MAPPAPVPDPGAGRRPHQRLTNEVPPLLQRGDSLTASGHYLAGQQAYRRAVQLARKQGKVPTIEQWRLAAALYFDGQNVEAARTLDELVAEAGEVGDLAVEGRAMFGAAWLWGQAGHAVEARAHVARLKKLMASTYFPTDVRTDLSPRLAVPETGKTP